MESEMYSWTVGWIRSDWVYRDADDAYVDAKGWCQSHGRDIGLIKIWRKLVEEVLL